MIITNHIQIVFREREPGDAYEAVGMASAGACNSSAESATLINRATVMKGRAMMDRGSGTEGGEDSAILIPLHEARRERLDLPVTFDRRELDQILRLYGRMVAANEWRDYAIDHLADRAVFSVFRRTSETPLFRIVKNPALARKQGAWSVDRRDRPHPQARPRARPRAGVFDKTLKLVEA